MLCTVLLPLHPEKAALEKDDWEEWGMIGSFKEQQENLGESQSANLLSLIALYSQTLNSYLGEIYVSAVWWKMVGHTSSK